jgi:hypothetical protein
MSDQKTLKDSPNVISSQESEDGVEHYNSQDGVQTDLFGQEALPVSPSQQPGKEKEKMTHGIFGQSSLISSESANLQQSLVSRLRQLSDLGGSTIYKLTLKEKVTPQGRSYFQLAASVPRTKERDSSSWPTPKAKEVTEDYDQYIKRMKSSKHEKNRGKTEPASVSMAAQLTSWPTPTQRDYKGGRKLDSNAQNSSATTGVRYGLSLDQAPQLVPWLTPTTSDMNGVWEMDGKRSGGLNTQAQSAWPTPTARDVAGKSGAGRQKRKGNPSDTVPNAAATVPWATPNTMDHMKQRSDEALARAKTKGGCSNLKDQIPLTQQVSELKPWATPNTMDHMALRSDEALLRQATVARKGRTFPANLREQVDPRSQEIYASGKIPQSSTAETENTAPSQLNPRFSLWLMGYPIEWAYSGERVTPLSRKRQPKS